MHLLDTNFIMILLGCSLLDRRSIMYRHELTLSLPSSSNIDLDLPACRYVDTITRSLPIVSVALTQQQSLCHSLNPTIFFQRRSEDTPILIDSTLRNQV